MKKHSGLAPVGGGLYYEIEGQGPELIFIHGGLSDSRVWNDQFDYFKEKNTVIRFDLRGFGQSAFPYKLFYPARDLKKLLEFLSVEKASLTGLSLGGAVAMDFALAFPDMIRDLVLAAPQVNGFPYQKKLVLKGAELLETARKKGAEDAVRRLFEDPFWEYTLPSLSNLKAREKMRLLASDFFHAFRWNPGLIRWIDPDPIPKLSAIPCPVLLLRAGRDHHDTNSAVDLLASKISDSLIREIPEAGHMMNLEFPDRFNRLLHAFLENLET